MTSLSGADIKTRIRPTPHWDSRIGLVSRLRKTQWPIVNLSFAGLGLLLMLVLVLTGLNILSVRIGRQYAEPVEWAIERPFSTNPSTLASRTTSVDDIPSIQFAP